MRLRHHIYISNRNSLPAVTYCTVITVSLCWNKLELFIRYFCTAVDMNSKLMAIKDRNIDKFTWDQ